MTSLGTSLHIRRVPSQKEVVSVNRQLSRIVDRLSVSPQVFSVVHDAILTQLQLPHLVLGSSLALTLSRSLLVDVPPHHVPRPIRPYRALRRIPPRLERWRRIGRGVHIDPCINVIRASMQADGLSLRFVVQT